MAKTTLLWLRRTLRLADNPALVAACKRAAGGGAVVPVYIDSPEEDGGLPMGGASRWWLHHSLKALQASLEDKGSRLILRVGPCERVLREVIEDTGADAVYWDRCYEPAAINRDKAVMEALRSDKIEAESFNCNLMFEPWEVKTGQGTPYKVFTPFWRTCQQRPAPDKPSACPRRIPGPKKWPGGLVLDELALLPTTDWAGGLDEAWEPGEIGASKALKKFSAGAVGDYEQGRDRPDLTGTSRLSPYLHFGEISPRQIWHKLTSQMSSGLEGEGRKGAWAFLREVGWREFAYHLMYHFPETATQPLRPEYAAFPWLDDPAGLSAWQKGLTGYPIVDAGMRQLWETGWMHNRVRMIVASFLVKDLLIDWRDGAAWFWDTLVDADLASNSLGWQWTAGCGADAAPYFRVFNPTLQGRKFDPDGAYVRRYVPELAAMPAKFIHEPGKAPAGVLADAGVELGHTYPSPIIDHGEARDRALQALDTIKKNQ